jgi:hypothetical protein
MHITDPKQLASLSENRYDMLLLDDFTGMIFTAFVQKRSDFSNWSSKILFKSEAEHKEEFKTL